MWQIVAVGWSMGNDIGQRLGDYAFVTYQDLCGIVTHSTFDAVDKLSTLERVTALFEYQSIIDRASIDNRILPVRFGTVVSSKRDVRMILQRGAQRLRSLLQFAEDKAELDFMGIWREKGEELEQNLLEDLEKKGFEIKVHKPSNEAICFHMSILIAPREHATFTTYKEELNKRLGHKIDLRVSELLPPYSFLTVDLQEGMTHLRGI